MTETTQLVTALVLILLTAVLAVREATSADAAPRAPRRRRHSHVVDPAADPVAEPAPPAPPPRADPRQREWLLDSLPLEPAGPLPDRAAGAGRLLIGITGMAIAAAIAILGVSRGVSALVDRFLR